jgi:hypothetical protein
VYKVRSHEINVNMNSWKLRLIRARRPALTAALALHRIAKLNWQMVHLAAGGASPSFFTLEVTAQICTVRAAVLDSLTA